MNLTTLPRLPNSRWLLLAAVLTALIAYTLAQGATETRASAETQVAELEKTAQGIRITYPPPPEGINVYMEMSTQSGACGRGFGIWKWRSVGTIPHTGTGYGSYEHLHTSTTPAPTSGPVSYSVMFYDDIGGGHATYTEYICLSGIVSANSITQKEVKLSCGASRNQDERNLRAFRNGSSIKVCAMKRQNNPKYDLNYTTGDARTWHRHATGSDDSDWDVTNAKPGADYILAYKSTDGTQWFNSEIVPAISTPNPVQWVSGKHKGKIVNFRWSEPPGGATTYNMNVSKNGGRSWHRLFTGYRQTKAHLKNGNPNHEYIFAVQACNSRGCSGWTNSPVVTSRPGPVSSVTLTWEERTGYPDKTLYAFWPPAERTESYHVGYSWDGGQTWCTRS